MVKARMILLTAALLAPAGLPAAVTHSVNEENGLRGWRLLQGDIEIELIQRLPDQTRALFMNHNFSRELIERLALSCMFQTIIRNTGASGDGKTVHIDLREWRMHHDGHAQGMLLKEPLIDSFADADADSDARLVVRWGMFPTEQSYRPSDYNWGLTAYGIPPGSTFDLDVTWREGDRRRNGRIQGIVCAPDVDRLK